MAAPVFTPADITTLLWLDAADAATITATAGLVESWVDKSGNAYEFTAAGSDRPVLDETEYPESLLYYESAGMELVSTLAPSSWKWLHSDTPYELYVVYRPSIGSGTTNDRRAILSTSSMNTAAVGFDYWWDDRDAASRTAATVVTVSNGSSGNSALTLISDNYAHHHRALALDQLTVDCSQAVYTDRGFLRFEGGDLDPNVSISGGTYATSGADPATTLTIGNSGLAGTEFQGWIAEIVIVPGSLGTEDRQKMEGYLSWKWGFECDLPIDHPYSPGVIPAESPSYDPHWDSVVSFVPFEDTAGTTAVYDAKRDETWTRAGAAATVGDTAGPHGQAEVGYCNGSSSRFISPAHADFQYGTADFTIEGWVAPVSGGAGNAYGRMLLQGNNGASGSIHWVRRNSPNPLTLMIQTYSSGYATTASPAETLPNNEWTHVAVSRKKSIWRMFYNGVLVSKRTAPKGDNITGNRIHLGCPNTASEAFRGYYSNWRVTAGVCRYDRNFEVPVASFALTSIPPGPTIDTQPSGVSLEEGDTASFTVAATGTGTLSYQWFETTAGLIPGATSATYSFTAAVLDDGTGYYCAVTDDNGTTESSTASLSVAGDIVASVTPVSIEAYPTDEVVLTCTAAGGTGTLTYQWYEVTAGLLVGETGDTLTLASVSLGEYLYYCIVSGDLSSLSTNNAAVSVVPAPALSVDISPIADAGLVGETIVFTATFSGGSGDKTYQWYEVTAGLLGAETASTLTLTAALVDSGNQYYCEITDNYETRATVPASLTVYPILAIDTQPQAVDADAGEYVTFSVVPDGTGPYTYQWYAGDELLVGETAAILIVEASPDRAADYSCIVGDATAQVIESDAAALTVTVQPPAILVQPSDALGYPNGAVAFQVSATGFRGLAYQWYRNDVAIAGAAGDTLAVTELALGDDGDTFYCAVSDGYGNTTNSDVASLSIVTVTLDDQTTPKTPSTGVGTSAAPVYTHHDFVGLVRAAEGPKPTYHDTYRFSGRTFQTRDHLTNERNDD